MSEPPHVIPIFVDRCTCSVLIAPVTVLVFFKNLFYFSLVQTQRRLNDIRAPIERKRMSNLQANVHFNGRRSIAPEKRRKWACPHVMFTSSHHGWSELELINTRLLQSHVTQESLLIGPFRTKTDVRGPSWVFVRCERRIRDSLLILV